MHKELVIKLHKNSGWDFKFQYLARLLPNILHFLKLGNPEWKIIILKGI